MGAVKEKVFEMTNRVLTLMHNYRPFNLFLLKGPDCIQNITVTGSGWHGDKEFKSEEEIFEFGEFIKGRPLVKYDLYKETMEVYVNDEKIESIDFKKKENGTD